MRWWTRGQGIVARSRWCCHGAQGTNALGVTTYAAACGRDMDVVGRIWGAGDCIVAAGGLSRCWRWLMMRPRAEGLALASSSGHWWHLNCKHVTGGSVCRPRDGQAAVTVGPRGNHIGTVFRLQFRQEPRVVGQRRKRRGFLPHLSRNCPCTNYLVSLHIFGSFFIFFCVRLSRLELCFFASTTRRSLS